MRANEFLVELFKPGKSWGWEFRGSEEAIASFTVGNVEYIWHAHSRFKFPNHWIVEFKVRDEIDQDKMFGLTGTGNAAEVMSIVTDITRSFLNEYQNKISEISFISRDRSRTSLYSRMIERLLPDWKLEKDQDGDGMIFYLTNPNQVSEAELEEDLSRRGFLGGLAATAATGTQAAMGLRAPKEFTVLSHNPDAEITLQKAAIGSGLRGPELAQFLAQMKHESWNFGRLKEKPMGKGYFEKRYGIQHAPKTAKILGNVRPGDGEKYHGRGFVQLTGRDNYRMASEALGMDLLNNPELAARPDIAAKIAVWYWKTRVKPNVANFKDTATVTKYINPALRGLKDRHENFIDYYKIL